MSDIERFATPNPDKLDQTRMLMSTQSHLPLPQDMRERFANYPSHVDALQQALDAVLTSRSATPVFERAIWAFEDKLSRFVDIAQDAVDAARLSGQSDAIALADRELLFMENSKSIWNYDLKELQDYLAKHVGVYS